MFREKSIKVGFGLTMIVFLPFTHPGYVSSQTLNFIVFESMERILICFHVEFHPVGCAFKDSSITSRQDLQALPCGLSQHRSVKPYTLVGDTECATQFQDHFQQFLQTQHRKIVHGNDKRQTVSSGYFMQPLGHTTHAPMSI